MNTTKGYGSGILGVAIFSASLPATRIAEVGFTPLFLTAARAVLAATVGLFLLLALRQKRPARHDLVALAIVAAGVVIGFPLLTALALQRITAAHSIVWTGLLPLATALFGVLRCGERPAPAFWAFSVLGAVTVAGFALHDSHSASPQGDALMLAAIALCGLGYAEGAALSKRLGGWQVISWALVLASPAMGALAILDRPAVWHGIAPSAWVGLLYVSLFSMMLGFVFWYRGLALGGTARIGQLQLLQPFGGLALSAALLGEPVPGAMVAVTAVVVVCVLGAKRFA